MYLSYVYNIVLRKTIKQQRSSKTCKYLSVRYVNHVYGYCLCYVCVFTPCIDTSRKGTIIYLAFAVVHYNMLYSAVKLKLNNKLIFVPKGINLVFYVGCPGKVRGHVRKKKSK